MSAAYEYLVEGVSDEWTPSTFKHSDKWTTALDAAFELLTVTEVAFTLGATDAAPLVIRYRKATP